jgi:hypothetical protein
MALVPSPTPQDLGTAAAAMVDSLPTWAAPTAAAARMEEGSRLLPTTTATRDLTPAANPTTTTTEASLLPPAPAPTAIKAPGHLTAAPTSRAEAPTASRAECLLTAARLPAASTEILLTPAWTTKALAALTVTNPTEGSLPPAAARLMAARALMAPAPDLTLLPSQADLTLLPSQADLTLSLAGTAPNRSPVVLTLLPSPADLTLSLVGP